MKPEKNSDLRVLFVIAAPSEARAVLSGLGLAHEPLPPEWSAKNTGAADVLISGVGKANAAGATAFALATGAYRAVVNLGVCGVLPCARAVPLGATVLAERSVFADEGVQTPDTWAPMSELGFPAGVSGECVNPDPALFRALRPLADSAGAVATVSTCSGTDERAREISRRLGPDAIGEAMEGAAVGLAAARLGVPFVEIRVVSNTTGLRSVQAWDLRGALNRLEALAPMVLGAV